MSKIELPKFHETFNKILDILSNSKTLQARDMINKVIDKYYSNLPEELMTQKTKSGDIVIINRISWGKSYLKKSGYIVFPERGFVKITKKGIKSVSKTLNLKDIKNSDEFKKSSVPVDTIENVANNIIENSTPQDLIDSGFNQIENEVKSDLLEKLKVIDPYYFEKVILILLQEMGYGDFIETSKSGDGGIDGIINEDKLGLDKIFIQAKRYGENKVREKDIRNFIGAMSGDTSKGVFVTTSDFHEGAIKKAHDAHHTIVLINGVKLVDLLHQYNVGIQIHSTYEVKELDLDFFESN